jgi:hypothetical protein
MGAPYIYDISRLRVKGLMSSGSKKRTQIYYPFFSKPPGKRIPPRFRKGAPMERDTGLQNIFKSLLIYLLISKALRKERPSTFTKTCSPMETDAHSRALLKISFGFPSKGTLLHSSFKVPGKIRYISQLQLG